MNIESIQVVPPPELSEPSNPLETNRESDFGLWLDNQLDKLNEQLNTADSKLEKLASGEYNNLHDVMMSLEKAKLSFQLVVQVRNKLLEGYQEVMRMQV